MRLNQNGISLIELLVAAVLTAAVALGGAYVVSQTQRVNMLATAQSDVDRVHYLHLQIARNVANIQKLYNINISANMIANDPNSNFLKCLQMNPAAVNCQQYSPSPSNPNNTNNLATVLDSHGNSILPVVPNISSNVTISPHCATYCDYISINVTTSYKPTGSAPTLNVSSRTSTSNLPNFLFVPRNAIDYTLGTGCKLKGQVMIGIDYTNQTPICGSVTPGLDGSSNTQQLPLLVYDSGATNGVVNAANTTACPFGYASAGFGSSSCSSSAGNLTAPPPTTTTTTTVPGPLSGVQETLLYPSCFVAGTQVTMADGSTKAIEDIKVGEKILTYDEVRNRQVISPVVDVFHHTEKDSDLYTMTLDNGTHITSNDVHPFFLADYHQYESAARIYDLWAQGSEIHLLSSKNHSVTV